jgi:hypothetical protein
MSTFYCDSVLGTGGGDGSEGDPVDTLALLEGLMGDDDSAFIAGTYRREQLDLGTSYTGIVAQWDGRAKALLRGDAVITGTWTNTTGAEWSITYTDTLHLGVSENWDTNINSDGYHFGHLTSGTAGALNAGEFDRVGTLTTVRLSDDSDPNSAVMLRHKTGNAIDVKGTGWTIRGINFSGWVDSASANGYSIRAFSTSFGLIENCHSEDGGFHTFGFVSTPNNNNTILNCSGTGCNNGGSVFVMAVTNGTAEEMLNNKVIGCHCELYGTIDALGVERDESLAGFFCHTAGTDTIGVAGCIFKQCTVGNAATPHSSTSGSLRKPFGTGVIHTAPTDINDYTTYSVQFIDCSAPDCQIIATIFGNNVTSVAFVRCNFVCLNFEPGWSIAGIDIAGAGHVLIESCAIIFSSQGTQDSVVTTQGTGVMTLTLRNCLLYNIDTDFIQAHSFVRNLNATVNHTYILEGCIFAYDDPGLADANSRSLLRTHQGTLTVNDCWYDNIAPSHYNMSGPVASDTESDWTGTVDVNGIYNVDPGLTASVFDVDGQQKKVLANGRRGLNGQRYAGNYGCYQKNSSGDLRNNLAYFDQGLVVEL